MRPQVYRQTGPPSKANGINFFTFFLRRGELKRKSTVRFIWKGNRLLECSGSMILTDYIAKTIIKKKRFSRQFFFSKENRENGEWIHTWTIIIRGGLFVVLFRSPLPFSSPRRSILAIVSSLIWLFESLDGSLCAVNTVICGYMFVNSGTWTFTRARYYSTCYFVPIFAFAERVSR